MNRSANNSANLATRPAQTVRSWNPWSEFDQMRRQMDDLVGGLVGYSTPRLPAFTGNASLSADFDFSPDIYETAGELIFVAPVPGLDIADLNIEATENTLTIRGEREPLFQQEGATQHRQSWWSSRLGAFQASYTLPFEINPEAVEAQYRNGVLELHLPKAAPNKPKTVKVNVSGETAAPQVASGQPATIEAASAENAPEASAQ